ncbi:MAG: hypothetical protein Kow0020_11220 [Wenzhouxiangellaceae bacterium]
MNPIVVSPSFPTTETEVVVTFTGGHGCPVTSQSVEGNEFVFAVRPVEGPCLGAPLPYQYTWNLGLLEEGEYHVRHINETNAGSTESSQSFIVYGGPAPPLPVPAIDGFGLVVLGVLLIAGALIKRSLGR